MSGSNPIIKRKQSSPLLYFLVVVFLLFIGILVFVYNVTTKTHPIHVDERGNPTNAQTGQTSAGAGHHP